MLRLPGLSLRVQEPTYQQEDDQTGQSLSPSLPMIGPWSRILFTLRLSCSFRIVLWCRMTVRDRTRSRVQHLIGVRPKRNPTHSCSIVTRIRVRTNRLPGDGWPWVRTHSSRFHQSRLRIGTYFSRQRPREHRNLKVFESLEIRWRSSCEHIAHAYLAQWVQTSPPRKFG